MHAATLVAFGQKSEENLHLVAILLHMLGRQQLLYEQTAKAIEDTPPFLNEALARRAEQMRLAAAGVTEREDILAPIQESSVQQGSDSMPQSQPEPVVVKVIPSLLQRQFGFAQQTLRAPVEALLALHLAPLSSVPIATCVPRTVMLIINSP